MRSVLLLAVPAASAPLRNVAKGLHAGYLDKYEGLEPSHEGDFEFEHQHSETVSHPYYGTATKSSFRSPPIHLATGEAWFTLPTVNRMPFPKPPGGVPFAMVKMEPDLIEENGRRPPVSELYGHHWLIYDKLVGGSGDNLGCGGEGTFVSNIFGSGAEMRGTCGCDIPDGYGLYSTQGQGWYSANIHLIRHDDLSTEHFQDSPDPLGAAHKACIECNWSPGNTGCKEGSVGDFSCCRQGSRCLTNNMADKTKKTYYLTYNITWVTDLTQAKPLQYGVVDTFACGALGNIKQNMKTSTHTCDDKICVGEVERTVDKTGEIIWMYGHSHVGAINGSVYLNGEYVCTSTAHYGNDASNPIGNEKGYINGFDVCIHASLRQGAKVKSLKVKTGDKIKVRQLYNIQKGPGGDPRTLPMPADGMHGGVMGLFYFFINVDSYKCEKAQCVPVTHGGVALETCQAACG